MSNRYDELYNSDKLYWGTTPSKTCDWVIKHYPAKEKTKLLVAGCGEGRNAIYLAKHSYCVSAFDLSPAGIKKTRQMAERSDVTIAAFVADIRTHRLSETFDIIFSTGVLHYIDKSLRSEIINNYKANTAAGGLHVLSVFVEDKSVPSAPDAEPSARFWTSGELESFYSEWDMIESISEIFDCNSGGQPHQHAVNRIVARKPE